LSIFREHKSIADRSATDRARHKKLLDRAIKDGLQDAIADESIIGQSGSKKIKIPVRGIKEYRFVYGNNEKNKKTGSGGDHAVQPGDQVGKKEQKKRGESGPGNSEGEEVYEVEVTLEELVEYLFADLELPDLEKKRFKFVKSTAYKQKGYRKRGIRPRLSKKETIKRKIRRKKSAIASGTYDPETDERFPFHEDDLKYKHMKHTTKESSSAVVFMLMDVSGSMTSRKKYFARSFFFLLYQFLNHKYDNLEVVFISHTTVAKEVSEDQFFSRMESGGTMMSSALKLEKEIIEKRYHPSSWNIYTFYAGDGENWSSDNEETFELLLSLKDINQMMCYTEIVLNPSHQNGLNFGWTGGPDSLWELLSILEDSSFHRGKISEKEDIWGFFKHMFGRR
jgi:sporulation protein YhbH